MSYVDMNRLQDLLAKSGIDGLLVVSPENFAYFAGTSGFPVAAWRHAGPTSAVVNQAGEVTFVVPDTKEGAVRNANPNADILSYPLWIERIDVDPESAGSAEDQIARATNARDIDTRPETFAVEQVTQCIQDAIADRGLLGKRLGIELEFAPFLDVERFREHLGDTEFVDSTPMLHELRVIKSPREIELLRIGTALAERGIEGSLEGVNSQTLALDIYTKYHESVTTAVRQQRIFGFESARTTVHMGPQLWGTADPERTLQRGDLIQFDSGVQLSGYQSDIGRTFSFGPPTETQRRIQDALLAGWEAGLAALKPGNRYCDVFTATQEAVRSAGFPSYTRGHFGHSIGSDIFAEEWPWLSETEQRVLEPGMVIAFEVPYYINGIGGFQNEDNILITEEGHESFNTLPIELTRIGA